jgi:hypothetical protein
MLCEGNILEVPKHEERGPWAPTSSSDKHPSWIATRDRVPFGDPSQRLKQRLQDNPLIGSSQNESTKLLMG